MFMESPITQEVEQKDGEVKKPVSHGVLFGKILFVVIVLLILGVIGAIAWGGYRGFQMNTKQAALPSIATLSTKEAAPSEVVVVEEKTVVPEKKNEEMMATNDEVIKSAKATEIHVLNGGATKGSASTAAEALKKNGYTKTVIGNTLNDFSGTVVYFSSDKEKEAGQVKLDLIKTYPAITTKPADTTKKETALASLVLILGK